jgi:hypothetical protein
MPTDQTRKKQPKVLVVFGNWTRWNSGKSETHNDPLLDIIALETCPFSVYPISTARTRCVSRA